MELILHIVGTLFAMGLLFVLSDLLGIPSLRVATMTLKAGKRASNNNQNVELWLLQLAYKASKIVHLDEYRKRKLTAGLKSTGIHMSAETYIASAGVRAGLISLLIIPCALIVPLATPVILFIAIGVYFKEIQRVDEQLKKKRGEIEYELPRFASTLTQQLKYSRDVLSILENYKKSAGETMKRELNITVADMKSDNFETALTRFETRIGSASLSDIVRGLISVIRGDDGVVYFQMLSHDLKQLELQRLKTLAIRQPEKVKKYSFLMLVCFVGMYAVVLAVEIFSAMTLF